MKKINSKTLDTLINRVTRKDRSPEAKQGNYKATLIEREWFLLLHLYYKGVHVADWEHDLVPDSENVITLYSGSKDIKDLAQKIAIACEKAGYGSKYKVTKEYENQTVS